MFRVIDVSVEMYNLAIYIVWKKSNKSMFQSERRHAWQDLADGDYICGFTPVR